MIDWRLYDYYLPKDLLALKPAVPRDSSRLFVYNTQTNEIVFDRFYRLDKYLPQDSFLVLNQTKVLPARVRLFKQNGGKLIALLFVNELTSLRVIKALVDREITVGDKLFFDKNHCFEVVDQEEKIFYLRFGFSRQWLINKLLEVGRMPVPLYLRKTPLKELELRKKYQTTFARIKPRRFDIGSVAAPTASLHFTDRVFKRLDERGIKKYFVSLHVGLGTFAPISEKNIQEKKLHEEYFEVNNRAVQSISRLKQQGKNLVAVGTTVVRALESFAISNIHIKNQKVKDEKKIIFFKKTNLFIYPPFEFGLVDCLLTNFHLPRSSLMMLVEAFLQYKGAKGHLIELYRIAIEEKFRFYSFGDSMLIR